MATVETMQSCQPLVSLLFFPLVLTFVLPLEHLETMQWLRYPDVGMASPAVLAGKSLGVDGGCLKTHIFTYIIQFTLAYVIQISYIVLYWTIYNHTIHIATYALKYSQLKIAYLVKPSIEMTTQTGSTEYVDTATWNDGIVWHTLPVAVDFIFTTLYDFT